MIDTTNTTDSRLLSEISLSVCLWGFVYTGVAEEARHILHLSCSISLACSLDWMKRRKWRKGAPAASSSSRHYPWHGGLYPDIGSQIKSFLPSFDFCQTFYQGKETSTIPVWVTAESSWRSEKGQNTALQPVYLLFINLFFGAFMVCVCVCVRVCIHVSARMLQHTYVVVRGQSKDLSSLPPSGDQSQMVSLRWQVPSHLTGPTFPLIAIHF